MLRFIFSFLSMILLTGVASANTATTYTLDPSHTRVVYGVSHLGYSFMPGRFNDISGTILLDPANPAASSLDVTINAKSVTMDNAHLDEKLLGKDFFNTEQFPTITFKSTKIEKVTDTTGKVTGDLTLLGVTKPVTLDVVLNKQSFNKYMGAEAIGFSASGKILRSDFGLKFLLPDVGDEVTLNIQAEAMQPKEESKTGPGAAATAAATPAATATTAPAAAPAK